MSAHQNSLTHGTDHIGLTVRDLEATRAFFCDCLGWEVFGTVPSYPAVFVSDGQTRLTLWQVADQAACEPFDRRRNVGLHHLAFRVADRAALDALFARVSAWPGVTVEFAPELLGQGPRMHCMIREPSGLRLEFGWAPSPQ